MDGSLFYLLFMFLFQLLKVRHYWALAKKIPQFLWNIFCKHLSFSSEKCLYYSGETAEPHLPSVCAGHLMSTCSQKMHKLEIYQWLHKTLFFSPQPVPVHAKDPLLATVQVMPPSFPASFTTFSLQFHTKAQVRKCSWMDSSKYK